MGLMLLFSLVFIYSNTVRIQQQFFENIQLRIDAIQNESWLITARDEAERANSAKSNFLSRMSHELRTPLNAILGFGQLLENDSVSDPLSRDERAEYVHEILCAGDHLLELVNEVLDLSRIESGRLDLQPATIELLPFIQSLLTQIKPLATLRNIAISQDINSTVLVYADKTRLKQVMFNLLSNAIKYSHHGAKVHISSIIKENGSVKICIEDESDGIASELLPYLFRPFEKLKAYTNNKDGVGIGLALSKNLVEAMQGEIGVKSTLGKGSIFWFTLPSETTIDLRKQSLSKT